MHWLYLALAIVGEVVGTSALKASEGFTRFWPSVAVMVGYGTALFMFSLALKAIPVGIAYAIWSGVGIALIALIGWFLFGQKLDGLAFLGIGLIVAGVLVLQIASSSATT